jgi:hypothetical protein
MFLTFTLQIAADSNYAISEDKNQHAILCCLIMVCNVFFIDMTYFEIFPKMMNGFVQIKR